MINKKIEKILVFSILVLSLIVKGYGLSKSPPSVGFDEAALGYNAYSLLKTGKDEYGNFLPLSLRSFNDYKPALYSYLSIPFVAILGLNETSTRMVSVVAGTVSLFFLYLFLKEFIKNDKLRLFIFLVLSFEPWRVHFSRVALEANLSACFFVIGAWFLYKNKKILAPLFFALAAHSYHGARAAAPLLIVLYLFDPIKLFFTKNFIDYKKNIIDKNFKYLWMLLLFVLLLSPVFLVNKSSQVLTRLRQENVFYRYYPFTPKELLNKDNNPWLNMENNPLYYFLGIMSGHMLSYFSPISLGGRLYRWNMMSVQHIPSFSMIGWLETVLLVFGFVYLIKKIKINFKYRYLVYWVLAGAAPAALTWTWLHPLRSMNLYPAIEIIVALAFVKVTEIIKKHLPQIIDKLMLITGVAIICLSILFIVLNEYNYSVAISHGEYQPGGFKEGVPQLVKLQDSYDQVYIDSPHSQSYIFFLFYQSFDPKIVQSYSSIRPKPEVEGNINFDFGKYKFTKFDWPQQKKLDNTLFWISAEIREEDVRGKNNIDLIWIPNAVRNKAATMVLTKTEEN